MKKIAIVLVFCIVVGAIAGGVAMAEKPPGSGASKALLYDSVPSTCADGATDLSDGPYGFVILNTNANGNLSAQFVLKGALPDTHYQVWVNQYPGGCPGVSLIAITTNGEGNGNFHISVPRLEGATNFWVSAVSYSSPLQVLRSPSVVLA